MFHICYSSPQAVLPELVVRDHSAASGRENERYSCPEEIVTSHEELVRKFLYRVAPHASSISMDLPGAVVRLRARAFLWNRAIVC